MLKIFLSIYVFFISGSASACPNCAGSADGRDQYTLIILGLFVLLTYIPFALFYRMAKKTKRNDVEGN
jgi:hypothetical protein